MSKKTGIPAIDNDNEKLEQLEARSAKATGLVGKLFSLPHADGAAIYTVEEEKGTKVRIVNQPLLDAWQDGVLGAGGWFPTKQIEPIIRRQEGLSKAFERAAVEQKVKLKNYAEIVGAAALADLDPKADVYELASWAWKRGCRNGYKDARIMKSGLMPWASDIASAMADSNVFIALRPPQDKIVFIMLADKMQDPIIHRNAPPAKESFIEHVKEAFRTALGIAPEGLEVVRPESKYLDNTFLTIKNSKGDKVASVCYDAADGKILLVSVSFQIDEKGVRSE